MWGVSHRSYQLERQFFCKALLFPLNLPANFKLAGRWQVALCKTSIRLESIILMRSMQKRERAKISSPLWGEGQGEGQLTHRNHPHPHPLPKRERESSPARRTTRHAANP
ncbi:MAG: hypothetical protein AMJ88_05365 [Anaerolineae bacterium SM23_ 63]|nr:MAG: hypothetical protein AMJ88_05365 [Anaerolineae bacterium SM23_ 63]